MVKPGRRADKDKFLESLRAAREKAGMRQADLAAALGRHQSFVSKYESGERRLDVLELRAICRALDVSFTSFTRDLDKKLG